MFVYILQISNRILILRVSSFKVTDKHTSLSEHIIMSKLETE